ncbi:MAG: hypothetical protein ACXW2U_08880 [Telluria sp.]
MLANGIKQAATGAAGALTLAAIGAFPPLSSKYSVGANGDPVQYAIVRDSDGVGIEWGIGHLSAAGTFVRDIILETWDGATRNAVTPVATNLAAGGPYTLIVTPNSGSFQAAPFATDPEVNAAARYLQGAQWNGPAYGQTAMYNAYTHIVPFLLEAAVIATGLSLNVKAAGTTGATNTARMALYRPDKSGHVGNLIAETPAIPVGSTGVKVGNFASAQRLDPGWYFIAYAGDSNAALSATNITGFPGACPLWGTPSGDPGDRYVMAVRSGLTYASTGAIFPNPAGGGFTYYTMASGGLPISPTLVVAS